MKRTCVRTRQLKTAISVYGPSKRSKPNHCVRKGRRSRIRVFGSSQSVSRRSAVRHSTLLAPTETGDTLLTTLALLQGLAQSRGPICSAPVICQSSPQQTWIKTPRHRLVVEWPWPAFLHCVQLLPRGVEMSWSWLGGRLDWTLGGDV